MPWWVRKGVALTDHTPLTDEELAAMKFRWSLLPTPNLNAARLIAEVERLQAEVERLQAENAQLEKWIPSGW